MSKIWLIWKYSLGSFSDTKTENYDNYVAIIRTIILVGYMITNGFIVSGVIRHWDANSVATGETLEDTFPSEIVSDDTVLIKKSN